MASGSEKDKRLLSFSCHMVSDVHMVESHVTSMPHPHCSLRPKQIRLGAYIYCSCIYVNTVRYSHILVFGITYTGSFPHNYSCIDKYGHSMRSSCFMKYTGNALVLVPVYFIKHSVSCYIYYIQYMLCMYVAENSRQCVRWGGQPTFKVEDEKNKRGDVNLFTIIIYAVSN